MGNICSYICDNICGCIKETSANKATGGVGGHGDSDSPLHSPYGKEDLDRFANMLSDVHDKLKEEGEEIGKAVAAKKEETTQKWMDNMDEVNKVYTESKAGMEQKWKDTKDDMNKWSSVQEEALKDGVEMVTSVVDVKKTEVKEKISKGLDYI